MHSTRLYSLTMAIRVFFLKMPLFPITLWTGKGSLSHGLILSKQMPFFPSVRHHRSAIQELQSCNGSIFFLPVEDGVPQSWVDGRQGIVEQVEGAPLVDGPRQADALFLPSTQVFAAAVDPRL